jgi:hypothetical protein
VNSHGRMVRSAVMDQSYAGKWVTAED